MLRSPTSPRRSGAVPRRAARHTLAGAASRPRLVPTRTHRGSDHRHPRHARARHRPLVQRGSPPGCRCTCARRGHGCAISRRWCRIPILGQTCMWMAKPAMRSPNRPPRSLQVRGVTQVEGRNEHDGVDRHRNGAATPASRSWPVRSRTTENQTRFVLVGYGVPKPTVMTRRRWCASSATVRLTAGDPAAFAARSTYKLESRPRRPRRLLLFFIDSRATSTTTSSLTVSATSPRSRPR